MRRNCFTFKGTQISLNNQDLTGDTLSCIFNCRDKSLSRGYVLEKPTMFSTCWTAIYPVNSVSPFVRLWLVSHADGLGNSSRVPSMWRNGDGTQAEVGTSAWEARLWLDKYSFHYNGQIVDINRQTCICKAMSGPTAQQTVTVLQVNASQYLSMELQRFKRILPTGSKVRNTLYSIMITNSTSGDN